MNAFFITVISLYGLWILFLASMNLIRARQDGTLSSAASMLGTPVMVVTILLDVALNLVVGTILFLDRPREATLSQRLSRLCKEGGWRGRLSCWICTNLLDQFDPSGKHCK